MLEAELLSGSIGLALYPNYCRFLQAVSLDTRLRPANQQSETFAQRHLSNV
jgi:hypothetical protein